MFGKSCVDNGLKYVESGMQSGFGSSEPLIPLLYLGLIAKGCKGPHIQHYNMRDAEKPTSSFFLLPYNASRVG